MKGKIMKGAVKIAFLLAAGILVYEVKKSGGFTNTNIYKFLDETGALDFGEACLTHLKAFLYILIRLVTVGDETGVLFRDSCVNIHAYLDTFYKLILVCKNSILSLFEKSSQTFNKAFPTAVDDVSMVVCGALTSTKENLVMISTRVQNITLLAVNYASDMFRI